MNKYLGLEQKISLVHMEYAAFLALKGSLSKDELQKSLSEYVGQEIEGTNRCAKAVRILKRVWFTPGDIEDFRRRGLSLLTECKPQERLALYWGMLLVTYPFFRDVVKTIGLQMKLDSIVSAGQVGRQVKLLYGDRRPVSVAIVEVFGMLKNWGLLFSPKRTIYEKNAVRIENVQVRLWLAEAVVRTSDAEMLPLDYLVASGMTFPFDYSINGGEIGGSPYFEISRQGLDLVMVGVKK